MKMKMKIQLRRLETNEALNFECPDAFTLHDLRLQINESMPSSVHLSINRNDELFASSSQATLRSLGVKSGDLIYYSLNSSNFSAFDWKLGSSSSTVAQKMQAPVGESSGEKLTENATLIEESETNQAMFSDPMSIDSVGSSAEELNRENMVMEGLEPKDLELSGMDLAGRKRLSEPLFLKKILLEECVDTSESTTVIITVHAVMLDSGFVLFNPDSRISFSFSEEIRSISLNYTLPALISAKEPDRIESVSLKFQRLGHMIVVYGSLGENSLVRKVCFDKRKYVHIVDLLMETLESDKEDTLSIHDKVLMCWRMIKDGFVTPLLTDLSYKAGLKGPPCLMCLPPELLRKIVESLHGVYIASLACVCSELREMTADNELWKQICLKQYQHIEMESSDLVDWKERFASYWKEDCSIRFTVFREIMKVREHVWLRRQSRRKRLANKAEQ